MSNSSNKAVRVIAPGIGELVQYSAPQAQVWAALSANRSLRPSCAQAQMDGITDADMYVDNVGLPTYSELLLAARSLVALVDVSGLDTLPAFAGLDMSAVAAMRGLVSKVGI